RAISCASTWRRSSATDFLLRDCTCHQTDVPSLIRRQLRSGSPAPVASILITSAPKSPSVLPQNGPAINCPISTTRTPASGSGDSFFSCMIVSRFPDRQTAHYHRPHDIVLGHLL